LTLVRPVDAMVWELRAAWGAGWRVALTLDERCVVDRLEGTVDHVSATGAWVEVAGWHVPTDAVLAVHRPSRLGDSTARTAWSRPAYVPPQREELSSDDVGRP
jgi:hypothetical protein